MKNVRTVLLAVLLGIVGFAFAAAMASAFFGSFEMVIYAVLMVFAAVFIDNERKKLAAGGLKSPVFLSAVYIPSVIAGLAVYFCCKDCGEEDFFMALAALTGLLCAVSSVFTFMAEMVAIAVRKKLYSGAKSKK
ncbi:MAG: hypothetical protein NC228_08955 [[Eubacterium] siraeum]|nr:hypothetical protein [[Eubacterium] siraeum]